MNYFIGRGIDDKLTGIEKAQINRLKLFKAHGVPAKIVSFGYSRFWHEQAVVYGLESDDLCNLFDYFQDSQNVPEEVVTVSDLKPDGASSVIAGTEGDVAAINCVDEKSKKVICQIRYLQSSGQVQQVLWTNRLGQVDHTDSYDSRGFLAHRSWFNAIGNIKEEVYFTPSKEVAITVKYRNYEQRDVNDIVLANGEQFDSFDDLETYFLQQLAGLESSVFFLDRGLDVFKFRDMVLDAKRVEVIHNAHSGYAEAMAESINQVAEQAGKKDRFKSTKAHYEEVLATPGQIDAFLVATEAQKRDIQASYPETKPIEVVPVGFDLTVPSLLDWQKRNPYQVVVVSRISPEKGIDDAVTAFIETWKKIPQANLAIYGGATGEVSQDYLKQINRRILAAGAQNAIRFAGFRLNVSDMYDQAALFVMTSRSESFNISMQEALSHGVPALAYDIKYGPSDMIKNGSNGVLVPANNVHELAIQMTRMLSQPAMLAHMSQEAYRLRERYSSDAVWQAYQRVMRDL